MPDKEKYGHGRHGRRSIRLKDYDYSEHGAYFVTICAKDRQCLFGEIIDGEVRFPTMLDLWFTNGGQNHQKISVNRNRYPIVIMPNHFHSIIFIVGAVLWGARLWAHTRVRP